MMKAYIIKTRRTNLEILFTVLVIFFYLSRTAIPFFKFLFIPLYACLVLYAIIEFCPRFFGLVKEFGRSYFIILLLFLILVASFILSGKLYVSIFKDICNSIILLSFYFFLTLIISKKEHIKFFSDTFLILTLFFAFVISINGLTTLFNIFSIGVKINPTEVNVDSYSESVAVDNNFAQLFVFFGMITVLYMMAKTQKFWNVLILDLLLALFSISILFSGSRRGLFVFLLIIGFIILCQFMSLIKTSFPLKKIASGSVYYLIIMTIVGCLFFAFINYTSFTFKNKALEFIGAKNNYLARRDINFVILKFYSAFNNSITYSDIDKIIWTPDISPSDPDSGWGTRIHKTVYPLTGMNSEIVPPDAKGYLMDKNCNSDSRSGNAYSHTAIFSKNVAKDIALEASVYCYVSEDFDGTWAMLSAEGTNDGQKESEYDLGKKGTWQKLKINVKSTGGISNIFLYFSKYGVDDFSSLSGHVIFANPEVRELYPDDTSMILNNSENGNRIPLIEVQRFEKQYYMNVAFSDAINHRKLTESRILKSDSPDSLSHPFIDLSLRKESERYVNAYLFPVFVPFQSIHSIKDSLKLELFRLFSEDTTYVPLKNTLQIDANSIDFSWSRLERWKFAWQIYKQEFNLRQKIMGGGFNFLNWYGFYFLNDKTKPDWPHNPFISILLYSGLIGLFLYFYLLYKVIYYYFFYLKEYYIFFIYFLVTFFFSFFSGGSPFDPPFIGFLTILPIFINSVHNKLSKSLYIK